MEGTTEYTYDALGQLLTETKNGSPVNTMTYDNYGNILTKNGKQYCYEDSIWKDKLTCYDGQSITYDAQGNPTLYRGHTLSWEKGRQLKTFDNNTYTYNANGIRTSKTVNGVKHTYTLDGARILRETWGSNTLIPLYDNEESVCGIVYNQVPYTFLKNLQGDVIAIADSNGNTVARYEYDAWGVCTATQNNGADIAGVNPFRYRGYYYDVETSLYYLQSRYYDPVVGRFLCSDDVNVLFSDNLSIINNLYCYCYNDCVNNTDVAGRFLCSTLIKLILGAVFGFMVQLFTDAILCMFERWITGKKVEFSPKAEDYIVSALEWAIELASPFKKFPKIEKFQGIIPLFSKYAMKFYKKKPIKLREALVDVFSFIISFLVSYVIDRKTAKKVKELSVYRRKGRKNTSLKMAKKEIKIKAKVLSQKIEFSISFVSDLINLILDFVEKEY